MILLLEPYLNYSIMNIFFLFYELCLLYIKFYKIIHYIMNYAPFICPHPFCKKYDDNYMICNECGEKICKHNPKYLIRQQLDKFEYDKIKDMPWMAGMYYRYTCKLCGKKNIPNNNVYG